MPEPARPNILLVLADSAQAQVYGCYGGGARTPHADRLAAEGARFERAYTAAPICHPARSVIDTGLYPHANGMLTNRCGRGAYPFSVSAGVPTLAERLRGEGYRTGYAGQGHIDVRGFDDDLSYPTERFREWLRERGLEERAEPERRYRGCGRLEGGPEVARDACFARLACRLIDRYAREERRPWFIQCDFDGPHPPCLVPAPFDAEYDPAETPLPASLRDCLEDVPPALRAAREAQGGTAWSDDDWRRYIAHFYGMTAFIDALLGRILAALERGGAAGSTLVLFSSDHGGMMGAHGFVMHGSPALYDPALRVPLLARWPGRTPPGLVVEPFAGHADLVPTLLEAAGAPPPECHGRSLAPLLRGEAEAAGREDAYAQYSGDGVLFYSARGVRSRDWSYAFAPHGGEQLYDLRADPGERVNRAGDPEARAGLLAMRRRLTAWMERVDDPLRHTGIWRRAAAEA